MLVAATAALASASSPASPVSPAPVRPIATTYAGTRVVDPYRYLEDSDDRATQAFVRDRDADARAVLARLDPARAALRRRIGTLAHGTATVDGLARAGGRFFYLRHGAGDGAGVLCVRDPDGANERVLVDPAQGLARGTFASVDTFLPSGDGRFVAYSISSGGPERAELHVLATDLAIDLPERIPRPQNVGPTAWFDDGRAFVYDRFPPLLGRHDPREERQLATVYRHEVGRSPEQDTPIFGSGVDPQIPFQNDDVPSVRLAAGSPFALGLVRHGSVAGLTIYVAPVASLTTSHVPWKRVADVSAAVADVALSGSTLLLVDGKNTAGSEIRAVSLAAPDLALATTVFPSSGEAIDSVALARDALYVRARLGAASRLVRLALGADGAPRGTPETIDLPPGGTIVGLAADPHTDGATVVLGSWVQPDRTFAVAQGTPPSELHLAASGALPAGVVADEERAPSADGTLVPITIVHGGVRARDGRRLALLEVDGAGQTTLPSFDVARAAWLERRGVWAICHPRGDGWLGEAWREAAVRDAQPRAVDDVLACAGYLERRGYANPARLVGFASRSAALALDAAIVRRPGLFAAAVERAPLGDPIRQQFLANGADGAREFGSVETPAGIRSALAASPYAHVASAAAYPAMLLTPGPPNLDVAPWQAAKLAARFGAAQTAPRPVLLRADEPALDFEADAEAFALWRAGDPGFAFVPLDLRSDVGKPRARTKRSISR